MRSPSLSRLVQSIFSSLALVGFPMTFMGQVAFLQGSGIPSDSIHPNWYLDTIAHRVYHRQSEWRLVPSAHVFSLRSCGKYILLTMVSNCYVALESEEFVGGGTVCECYDRLVRMEYENGCFFWGDEGFLGRAKCSLDRTTNTINEAPDTVGAVHAFCVSATENSSSKVYLESAHAWGMLGLNGKWIIEPKFDAPFRFENGFADVLYYGQKRRINEKGEFVE